MTSFVASSRGVTRRKTRILAAVAGAALASSSSAAWAACGASVQAGPTILVNQSSLATPPSAAAAAISGAIANVDTVFLTQQGSAFVSAPANPVPNQPGGGVWARAIGGEANVNTTSVSVGTNTRLDTGAVVDTSTTACANNTHERFAGVQVGADIARLNWNGWNLHVGTTAGYLGSKETDDSGFSNTF